MRYDHLSDTYGDRVWMACSRGAVLVRSRCHEARRRLASPGEPDERQSETTRHCRERPESADAATKTRRLAERRAFVESRLTSSSVPLQRVAGPRSFTVSPVRTFAPFTSL